uniref:Putative malate dehydrogenase 1B n=1 Tax=Malurus cyaneus samueli TaxID=2593467 RepID=A0A8C5TQ66_9PASS
MLSEEMSDIAEENLQAHLEIVQEDEEIKSLIKPLHIWITSASAPICYHLIPLLANGEVFGITTEISIHLLDTDQFKQILRGIVMEAEDMAFPLLRSISEHTEIDQAFIEADIIIVLDDVLLNLEVQPLENYIREVNEICQVYAPLIEKNAKSDVKVITSGKTFANLKAIMIRTYGPSIRPENIIAIATSWESTAKAMLARKLNENIADVIVWGNITGSNYIDLSHAKLYGYDCAIWGPPTYPRSLLNMIHDSEWIHSEILSAQSTLSSQVSHCAGMLPAHAVATVLQYWYHDSPSDEIISVGILSEGQFCIPEEIIFSMPVRFLNGNWEVITELEINETTQKVLERLSHELVQVRISCVSCVPILPPMDLFSTLFSLSLPSISFQYFYISPFCTMSCFSPLRAG